MFRISLVFLLIVVGYLAQGQDVEGLKTNCLSISTSIEVGSKELSSKFINKYFNGGTIDQATKDAFFDKLNSKNTAGAFWESEVKIKRFSTKSTDLNRSYQMIGFENYYLYEAEFSKDLFGLYFYGNRKYEDKTADLSNMHFKQNKFQIFKLGIYQRLQNFGLGINAGLVIGQNTLEINTLESSIYTAPMGRFLDVKLHAESKSTDLKSDKFLSNQGNGISVDFKLEYTLKEDSKVGISANRLGFVNYTKNTTMQRVDSNFHFEGLEITNILDSFAINLTTPEELKDDLVHTSNLSHIRKSLPTQYSLYLKYWFLNNKFLLNSKLVLIPSTVYKPSFQVDLNTKILNLLYVGVGGGVGGFSSWNMGLNAGFKLGSFISVQAEAKSLFNIYNLNNPASIMGAIRIGINF
ncbi:MAG: DUF5723 family protein [Saprospiraceae bacterium]